MVINWHSDLMMGMPMATERGRQMDLKRVIQTEKVRGLNLEKVTPKG
jgi:hypothetical protein